MASNESGDSTQKYSVAVSMDRDGFLRLTCPSCGLDFKIWISDAQLQHILESQVRRTERELMEGEEPEDDSTQLGCPYCGYRAPMNDMHTEETETYFQRVVHREVITPMMNEFIEEIGESWESGNRGSSGMVSFEANTSREILPPRPLHGPEPPDMKIIRFLCCGEQAKIRNRWYAVNRCPFCRFEVDLS